MPTSGPIVRTGTTPEFWKNWDNVFGDKAKKSKKSTTKAKKTAKGGTTAKSSAKKSTAKSTSRKKSSKK